MAKSPDLLAWPTDALPLAELAGDSSQVPLASLGSKEAEAGCVLCGLHLLPFLGLKSPLFTPMKRLRCKRGMEHMATGNSKGMSCSQL